LEGGQSGQEEQFWTPVGFVGGAPNAGNGRGHVRQESLGEDVAPDENTKLLGGGGGSPGSDSKGTTTSWVINRALRGQASAQGNNGKAAGMGGQPGGSHGVRPSISRNYDSFNSYLNDLTDSMNADSASIRSYTFPTEDGESDNETEGTSSTAYGTIAPRVRRKGFWERMKKAGTKYKITGKRYR
jgi:hypothetical protein